VTPRILFVFAFAASLISAPAFAQDDEVVPPPSAPPLPSPRSVWIHIDSGRVVMLQHLAPFDTVWTETCFSPCDAFAPLDGTYRIVAPAIVSSREVELEAQPGDKVVLDIHARTLAQRRTAETLSLASYVAGGVGLALEIGALSVNSRTAQTALIAAGVGAAVTGLTFVITSLVLGQPTGVSQSIFRPVGGSTPVAAAAPVPSEARGMAALTHEEGARGPLLPEATSAPLLTLTF
jgi:hypothetical protein